VFDATNSLDFSGGMPPTLAVSGKDSAGERVQRLLPDALVVGVILRDFGWGIVDVRGIESCRYFEAMCMVWVIAATRTNNSDQAFKLLRK